MNQIKQLSTEISVTDYLRDYVDIPTFLQYCKECPSYNQKWSCPPYDFDVLQYWSRHQRLLLRGVQIFTTPLPAGADLNASLQQLMGPQKQALVDELKQLAAAHPGSVVLSAGSCPLCNSCSRTQGSPCRHPGELRYSIEALGGDVAKTARELLGVELLWAQDGCPPAYWTLVAGLLI